jgi:putative sterol carrier protein
LLFVARDGDARRRILVTPGRRAASLDSAECTIECALADMVDAQSKGVSPMQLFVAGKLRLTGNVQIAMALAGAFG